MAIKQISVFVQNEKGALSNLLKYLSENQVDIRALSIADTTDFGILRIITADSEKTEKILVDGGYICNETDVVGAFIDDNAGGLSTVVELLANNGMDVEYLYAFVTKETKKACVVLRVHDYISAEKVLSNNGVKYLNEEDIKKF